MELIEKYSERKLSGLLTLTQHKFRCYINCIRRKYNEDGEEVAPYLIEINLDELQKEKDNLLVRADELDAILMDAKRVNNGEKFEDIVAGLTSAEPIKPE